MIDGVGEDAGAVLAERMFSRRRCFLAARKRLVLFAYSAAGRAGLRKHNRRHVRQGAHELEECAQDDAAISAEAKASHNLCQLFDVMIRHSPDYSQNQPEYSHFPGFLQEPN